MTRAGIDWERVRDRLRVSERALQEALGESPARIEAAYRRRAVRLAAGEAAPKAVSAGLPALVFRVAQERYAIELKELAEALPFARCTPVPGAPPQFRGVINVRGELRAVVDLGWLLAPSESGGGDSGFVLMLGRPRREVGLRVDRIEEFREIRREELCPVQGNYVNRIASGTLRLLSVETVLAEVFSREESLTT